MRTGMKRDDGWMGIGVAMAALLGLVNIAAADVITFTMGDGKTGSTGAKDAFIATGVNNAAAPYQNNGADAKLRIRSFSGSNPERISLLAYPNLIGAAADQIPAGATITSAKLRLNIDSHGSTNIAAYPLLADWDEGNGSGSTIAGTIYGVTWDFAKAFADTSQNVAWPTPWTVDRSATPVLTGPLGAQLSKGVLEPVVAPATPTYEEWDITAAVADWASGQSNFGVALWQSDFDNNEFRARETGIAGAIPPQLTVDFVVPEPASLGLLAIGGLLGLRRRRSN